MLPPAQWVPARRSQDQAVGASDGVPGVGGHRICGFAVMEIDPQCSDATPTIGSGSASVMP